MLHKPPKDPRDSYTVVETKQGNSTVTSYYKVRNNSARELADIELDEQFNPPTFGAELVTDSMQWLSFSVAGFRTLKYLWIVLGGMTTVWLGLVLLVPVAGLFTYQFLRQQDDQAGKALVLWRVALMLLGGLV